jgi:hypothetical protein
MSVAASQTSRPGDGDTAGPRRFAFRSADTAVDPYIDDRDAVSQDADDAKTTIDHTAADHTAADGSGDDHDVIDRPADDPQPTFTPVASGPVTRGPAAAEPGYVPVVPAQVTRPVAEAPLSGTAAINDDAPLLGDAVGLRASWQQAQAGFVDDPRAAVADAAELVEHTAQTLIGSLQQRQRQLRTQWDNNGSGQATGATRGDSPDTEQLRHLMQSYRGLFNQLCRP